MFANRCKGGQNWKKTKKKHTVKGRYLNRGGTEEDMEEQWMNEGTEEEREEHMYCKRTGRKEEMRSD